MSPSQRPRAAHRRSTPGRSGSSRDGGGRPSLLVVGIVVLGLALTTATALLVRRADQNAEERLLRVQTRQVATVLSVAISTIQQQLTNALDAQDTGSGDGDGDPEAFSSALSSAVGPDLTFSSASLWRDEAGGATRVTSLGDPSPDGERDQQLLDRALTSSTYVVELVNDGDRSRIQYALADPGSSLVVHATSPIAEDRRSSVDDDEAFADLSYEIHLGSAVSSDTLITTNLGSGSLDSDDTVYSTTVPFGDTVLTLTTSPRRHLGSPLSQRLPLILSLGGLLITAAAALAAYRLERARRRAESDTETITGLYQRVDGLYDEQRQLSVRLQHALLPRVDPEIPGMEVSSTYVAGAAAIDIGGDWYSAITTGPDTFAFVVGDVSGNGIDAVAEMARARFTLRAYLFDGDGPEVALEKCSRQFDVTTDGHIITALVGVGNLRTGEITVANAGHPLPYLASAGEGRFVPMPVGVPLGVAPSTYEPVTFTMPPGSTLLGYTDGLVERRGEHLDVGMERLASAVQSVVEHPLASIIAEVLDAMRDDGTADDIAVLALRRVAG